MQKTSEPIALAKENGQSLFHFACSVPISPNLFTGLGTVAHDAFKRPAASDGMLAYLMLFCTSFVFDVAGGRIALGSIVIEISKRRRFGVCTSHLTRL